MVVCILEIWILVHIVEHPCIFDLENRIFTKPLLVKQHEDIGLHDEFG